MEREPLQQLIERSIRNNVIDGHAIDQDGSNVLIIGEEIHYCSDEGARAFLVSRSERPTAAPQSGNGQTTTDNEAQEAEDVWPDSNGDGPETDDEDSDISAKRRGAEETYRDSGRPEARGAQPGAPGLDRRPTRSEANPPEARNGAAGANGMSIGGIVSRAPTGAIA